MSWFSAMFGDNSLSKEQRMLSRDEIQDLVSRSVVSSLSREEEISIEEAIDTRRLGDGQISLFQIYEALKNLENKGQISEHDRAAVVRIFTKYFDKRK